MTEEGHSRQRKEFGKVRGMKMHDIIRQTSILVEEEHIKVEM